MAAAQFEKSIHFTEVSSEPPNKHEFRKRRRRSSDVGMGNSVRPFVGKLCASNNQHQYVDHFVTLNISGGGIRPPAAVQLGIRARGATTRLSSSFAERLYSALHNQQKGRNRMLRSSIIGTSLSVVLCMPAGAASQYGTPAEAKAMLEKVVAAVKTDKEMAIAMFNKGIGGFHDRDLQPFCFRLSDGKVVASTTNRLGNDIRDNVDKNGNHFGKELYADAVEGKIGEVSYFFPRPGETNPVAKTSYVTAVNGLGCAVGFYK